MVVCYRVKPLINNDINYDPVFVNENRTLSICKFEKWCPGVDYGSAIRRHIHLTALIYPVISIWPIRLANVNQALEPLRYSLRLESTHTSASTPLMDTEHEPDLRLEFCKY